jgi:predicted dienelactone hydrolase
MKTHRYFHTLFMIILGLSGLLVALPGFALQASKVELDLGELPTGRVSVVSLWFPQGACADLPAQRYCLHEAAVTDRTLVLSHGAMGAADNYQWLARALAEAGYVVLGINHFGESWFYGPQRQQPQAVAFAWQRPQDISALYDRLSQRDLFQRPVNWSNVIALGHSSGAQTAAMLAGVRFDLAAMMAFCKTPAAAQDHACDYGLRGAPEAPEGFRAAFGADYRDARVKKIVLLDPTLGFGATAQSLAEVRMPSLVVGAQQNDFLPWDHHGARYAQGIAGASVHLLTGLEGHFVFLDPCSSVLAVFGVPLCQDRPGVNRTAIHQGLLPVILQFVQQDNISIDPPRALAERSQARWEMPVFLTMVLLYTPHWVFGLLAGLVVLGLMQVPSRAIAAKWVFIAPVSLLMMSLIGTVMDLGLRVISLLPWCLALAWVTLLRLRLTAARPLAFDRATGCLWLPGSWVPLGVILLIFALRYWVGMAKGMQWQYLAHPVYLGLMSAALGACSGYFLADICRYWQAMRPSPARSQG